LVRPKAGKYVFLRSFFWVKWFYIFFGSPGTPLPPKGGGVPPSPNWVGPGRIPPGLKKKPDSASTPRNALSWLFFLVGGEGGGGGAGLLKTPGPPCIPKAATIAFGPASSSPHPTAPPPSQRAFPTPPPSQVPLRRPPPLAPVCAAAAAAVGWAAPRSPRAESAGGASPTARCAPIRHVGHLGSSPAEQSSPLPTRVGKKSRRAVRGCGIYCGILALRKTHQSEGENGVRIAALIPVAQRL